MIVTFILHWICVHCPLKEPTSTMAERASQQPGQQPLQAHPMMLHPDQMAALQNCMQQIADTNRQILANAEGRRVKAVTDFVKRTDDCDGTTYRSLKQWFIEVEYTQNYSNSNADLLEVAVKTAKGELRREIETFLTQYASEHDIPRFETPWATLKTHLYATFIPLDEQDELREKLQTLKQGPSETVAVYNRRFKSIAEEAYPVALRNVDQQQILLKAYLKSLTDMNIRRPVVHSEPKSIEAAMFKAVQTEQFEKKLNSLGSTEEPMDISAVSLPTGEDKIERLIEKKLATMSISAVQNFSQNNDRRNHAPRQASNVRNNRITNPLAWTQDGRPICYECGKPGHIGRQCLIRNRRQTRGNSFTTYRPHNSFQTRQTDDSYGPPGPSRRVTDRQTNSTHLNY